MYFVPRQPCEGNPFLHFQGNTELFLYFRSYMLVNNNTNELVVAFPLNIAYENAHQYHVNVHCLSCSFSYRLKTTSVHFEGIVPYTPTYDCRLTYLRVVIGIMSVSLYFTFDVISSRLTMKYANVLRSLRFFFISMLHTS